MSETPKLPLLPGFSIYRPKKNNHLTQCFRRIDGTDTYTEKKYADNEPFLINNNNKILCFEAFCYRNCDDAQNRHIQRVNIQYFLNDGTIQVADSQKIIVERQPVPCGLPNHYEYLTLWDLNVRNQVQIFGRTYIITDCDQFTRLYLNRAGVDVPEPIDMSNEFCKAMDSQTNESKTCSCESGNDQPFEKFSSPRLKFNAEWHDRSVTFGEVHYLMVYYYLFDQTFQIIECPITRRQFLFMRRRKLPKKITECSEHFQKMPGSSSCCSERDSTCNVEYYTDADLKIGHSLNVDGRDVVLIDCDDFTRQYYREKYGIEQIMPKKKPQVVEAEEPIHNSCDDLKNSKSKHLVVELKTRQHNMKKFMEKEHIRLRFKAQIHSPFGHSDREFIITFYMDDDTISVYEIGKANPSGDFLKRGKFYLPNQRKLIDLEPYTSKLFYIGADICLNGFSFHLFDADEFTLNYMEKYASEYPMADMETIMNKIKKALCPIYDEFYDKYLKHESKKLSHETTIKALKELLGTDISDHEIVTFIRHFDADKSNNVVESCNRLPIQSMVQREIMKNFWDDLEGLEHHIHSLNPMSSDIHSNKSISTGPPIFTTPEQLKIIIKSCRIPLKDDLIENMFTVLNKDANGKIDVKDFLHFIDSRKYKAPPVQQKDLNIDYKQKMKKFYSRPEEIDWKRCLQELNL